VRRLADRARAERELGRQHERQRLARARTPSPSRPRT
jgi:hypothetical protein